MATIGDWSVFYGSMSTATLKRWSKSLRHLPYKIITEYSLESAIKMIDGELKRRGE